MKTQEVAKPKCFIWGWTNRGNYVKVTELCGEVKRR